MKLKENLKHLDNLSLGLSIVVALVLGIGLGIFLKNITGYNFFIFFGLFLGLGAAILNVYKAYKRLMKEFDKKQ